MSILTLRSLRFVLVGDFVNVTAEDAKWGLISRGATVATSFTRSNAAVIIGANAAATARAKAAANGTPVLDEAALHELLAGAPFARVVAASHAATASLDLQGKRFSLMGAVRGWPKPALTGAIEQRGGQVAAFSTRTDVLLVGEGESRLLLDALDSGVPYVRDADLAAFLGGASMANFIAPRGPAEADPTVSMRLRLSEIVAAFAAKVPGEAYDDELSLTLGPTRIAVRLRDLCGTPVHDELRRVVFRQVWPEVSSTTTLATPIRFY